MKTRILSLVLLSHIAWAQSAVDAYLVETASTAELQALSEQMKFASETSFRSPFFREFELRFRARDFEEGIQDYRFRMGFLNPYERRANKRYGAAIQQQLATQFLVDQSEIMARRYDLLSRHYFVSQVMQHLESKRETYTYLQNLQQLHMDGKELLEIERELFEIELNLLDAQSELRILEKLMGVTIDWSGFEVVDVATVGAMVRNAELEMHENIYVENLQNEVLVAESDLEISKQESFSNIGYIQAEYRDYRGESLDEKLGIQVGLQLPFVNPDRPDNERRQLELIEDQQESIFKQQEVVMQLVQLQTELETLEVRYDLVSAKLQGIASMEVLFRGTNLDLVREKQDFEWFLVRQKESLHAQVLATYFQWLMYRGELVNGVNYLAQNFHSLGDS